jgi:anhydro-N-acetylmuramic acid kinase
MDRDGALAAGGRMVPELLRAMLAEAYFAQPAPKSTGPEQFSTAWLETHLAGLAEPPSDSDVQATLVVLTARSIADAIRALPLGAAPEVFVCGGGAHNAAVMRALRAELPDSKVATTDALGVGSDWVEAMAFAWLARQRVLGLPGNCPRVTGASRAAVLGAVFLPE